MSRDELFEGVERVVACHYGGRNGLEEAVLAAVEGGATIAGRVAVRDLAPLDHFHTRGEAATRELAELVHVDAGLRVLDVGGGLGGAARLLASEHGCHVTVLEPTEEYVRLGEELTARQAWAIASASDRGARSICRFRMAASIVCLLSTCR